MNFTAIYRNNTGDFKSIQGQCENKTKFKQELKANGISKVIIVMDDKQINDIKGLKTTSQEFDYVETNLKSVYSKHVWDVIDYTREVL